MDILETAYRIPSISVLDVSGRDALTVINNLTTNRIADIEQGETVETFVTDVRGKTVGHVWVNRIDQRLRLMGASGQSERLIEHLDHYTVREKYDATVADCAAVVISKNGLEQRASHRDELSAENDFSTAWVGPQTRVVLESTTDPSSTWGEGIGSEESFHRCRIAAGMPWFGVDFDDSNLPQEIDRDAAAISLTKGCYLGQETVARLDALGQVQKKLVCWRVTGSRAEPGTVLIDNDKKVGKLTSIAECGDHQMAMGWARRSHFDVGSKAHAIDEASGQTCEAQVILPEVER